MKLETRNGQVMMGGKILQPKEFGVEPNRHFFEQMSSGLYPDKVKAVIRELSTNAADAHADAKQDQPFEVHLPNELEPWFAVKDWGTGLSNRDISKLYTTYFSSNRRSSDDFTGCMGLGSKSPFAYAQQFIVMSRFRETERTYTCFTNEEFKPCVVQTGQKKAREHDGLEVRLAVDPDDFEEFVEKAILVLSWFDPRPRVVGSSNFFFQEKEYLYQGEDYAVVKSPEYEHSYVRMGNVAYHLDRYDISGLDRFQEALVRHGVHLTVPIGAVQITTNREKLSYVPSTIQTVKDHLTRAVEDLKTRVVDQIEIADSIWQARKLLYKLSHSYLGPFFNTSKILWRGQQLSSSINLEDYYDRPISCEKCHKGRYSRKTLVPSLRKDSVRTITADGAPILINDLKNKASRTVANYMSNNNLDRVYLISNTRQQTTPSLTADGDECGAIEASGLYEEAILVSTLPEPPKLPRNYSSDGQSKYTKLMRFTGNSYEAKLCWENERDVKVSDGGIYVVIDRFMIVEGGNKGHPKRDKWSLHPREHQIILDHIGRLMKSRRSGEKLELYGVRRSLKAKLEAEPKWKLLREFAGELYLDLRPKLKDWLAAFLAFSRVVYRKSLMFFKDMDFLDGSPFGELIRQISDASCYAKVEEVESYMALANWLNHSEDHATGGVSTTRLSVLQTQTFSKYPLLRHIDWGLIKKRGAEEIFDYINTIDHKMAEEGVLA